MWPKAPSDTNAMCIQKLLSNNKTAMQAAQDVARTSAGEIGDGLFCQAVVGDHFLIPIETVLFHPGALLGIGLGAVHVDYAVPFGKALVAGHHVYKAPGAIAEHWQSLVDHDG